MFIISVPNRGSSLLPIGVGVTVEVSKSGGVRFDIVKPNSVLMGSPVRVGCEENLLPVFRPGRFLWCLVRSLVNGICIADDGVIAVSPYPGCCWSVVPLRCFGLLFSSLGRLSCLLPFIEFCFAGWVSVSSSLVAKVSLCRLPLCALPGWVSCAVIA